MCDYATHFPESFPLRTITTPAVMRALVQLFSRVGIPDEILTDQGTNFTSRLMQLFQKQLGISAIQTTPYHPQTDGLVERFNQTLKRMLQKFVDDTGKDWDRGNHSCSLPTVKFPWHQQVSPPSNCCMAGRYRDPWICSGKAGRHRQQPKATEVWCSSCWR